MTQAQQALLKKVEVLPADLQQEIFDFIEFVVSKKVQSAQSQGTPAFAWEGGLADLRGTYSSVELQHKAQEWR